ncbi:MAG: DUF3536 domain-containing protein [Thermodesulfobacteriota bacterium]
MDRFLCIHGHFYQPPREDPWLDTVLPEGSAAPSRNWNERICRESYAPLARARRLDGGGRIMEIFNLYEWISFNFGPTLCSWMARHAPETLARAVEGDRAGARRLGHGNALAQICHHVIMPLASDLDKHVEAAWAVADFRHRFGRDPEGMWLSETAVDTPSLEVLAENGITFTVLAPSQAAFVADLDGGNRRAVSEWDLDISRPYRAFLPSGRFVDIFFYHGGLSQAVAFERLLADGENFWRRLSGAAGPGLLSLATDGETYGHHFRFGEMALAYVMAQAASGRDGLSPTNYAAFLEKNPPRCRVYLREPSAWSCVHGVERWRSDCGCTNGGHPGYNQQWRGPLREALDLLKAEVDAHYFAAGKDLFVDARAALLDYGEVVCGAVDQEAFEAGRFAPGLGGGGRATAWKLLSMQRWAVSSFASCAWFFDELTRIEPVNALTCALRAMDLARATGMADPEPRFLAALERAVSNDPAMGDGRWVWENLVTPRRETTRTLAVQTLLTLAAEDRLPGPGRAETASWPAVSVTAALGEARDGLRQGRLSVAWTLESGREDYGLELSPAGAGRDPYGGRVRLFSGDGTVLDVFVLDGNGLAWNKRQAVADAFAGCAERRLWTESLALAGAGIRLVPELQEAQTTLNQAPLWAGLYPGLLWHRLFGPEPAPGRAALLDAFLRAAGNGNGRTTALEGRMVDEFLARLSVPAPDFAALALAVARGRAVGFDPDWWAVQNLLWERFPGREEARGLADLLWFAPA